MRDREDLDSIRQDAVDHDVRVSAKKDTPGFTVESGPPFRGLADGCHGDFHFLHKPLCRARMLRSAYQATAFSASCSACGWNSS